MTFLPRISSYAASILGRQSHLVCRIFPCWKTTFDISGAAQAVNLEFLSTAVRVQCYSSQQATLKSSWKKKRSDPKKVPATAVVEQDKNDANNVFFVVRKGDVVGVYKNFSECQAQVGSSVISFFSLFLVFSFFFFPIASHYILVSDLVKLRKSNFYTDHKCGNLLRIFFF
uniref:Uncharacterized protein MANES_15G104700 n=1 Tax=Rhizophora mucronata TaxID=61149 RepID=A0A2P2KAD4_RHIMU